MLNKKSAHVKQPTVASTISISCYTLHHANINCTNNDLAKKALNNLYNSDSHHTCLNADCTNADVST